jgi:hypothetical protein
MLIDRFLARRRAVAAAAGVLLAVVTVSAVTAVTAGNGLGAYVSLGFNNTIGNYATSITAAAAKNAFQVINTHTSGGSTRAIYAESRSVSASTIWANNAAGGTALALTVGNGRAPLRVTNPNAGTATDLSADKLDGVDSSRFARDIQYVGGAASAGNSTGPKSAVATCPPGKRLLGGGGHVSADDANAPVALRESRPDSALNTWTATAVEGSAYGGNWAVTAYAICATVTP